MAMELLTARLSVQFDAWEEVFGALLGDPEACATVYGW